MDLRARIGEITGRYSEARSAIMPSLYLAQDKYGLLSDDVLEEVAGYLDVPRIWVYEIATFYTMFIREPVGKYHLQLCTNVSCMLLETGDILDHLKRRLGIADGETSGDGLFTLSTVECLGSCGTAPVMQVNDDYHEELSIEKVDGILDLLVENEGSR